MPGLQYLKHHQNAREQYLRDSRLQIPAVTSTSPHLDIVSNFLNTTIGRHFRMSDLNCRLWLNWEAFEVASINPLFTADISLDRISLFARKFEDLTQLVSFEDFQAKITGVFKLNPNQVTAMYTILTVFLTQDSDEALKQTQVYRRTRTCLPSFTMTGTDILVYLFAIFVKKKFRAVSELSNLEAFPGKKEQEHLSPRSRPLSASTPTVSQRLIITSTKTETNHQQLMQRFFLNKLSQFLAIFAPDGLTRRHVESFSFLVLGGPTYAHRADNLIVALNLFQGTKIEDRSRFHHAIATLLPIPKDTELLAARNETTANSPLAYRPLFPRALMEAAPPDNPNVSLDKPWLITDLSDTFSQEVPQMPRDTYIHNCRNTTIFICGVVPTLFISHCKNSTIFVGAATAIRLENCADVRLIAATRMVHFDSCARCTGYLLTNTRPLLTGSCMKLVLAPYNGMYQKFGMDTLSAGINPALNLFDQPMILGSLGVSLFEKMDPNLFRLFVVPFSWENLNPMINPIIPLEYQQALESRRQRILTVVQDLQIIGEHDPELCKNIVDQIKSKSMKWIESEGYMNDIKWLYELEQ